MPDDPQPEEQVTIQGWAAVPGDDPLGPLIPARVKVPAGHPYLKGFQRGDIVQTRDAAGNVIRMQITEEVRPFEHPPQWRREVSQMVAEHARRLANYALVEPHHHAILTTIRRAIDTHRQVCADLGEEVTDAGLAAVAANAVMVFLMSLEV